MRGGPAAAALTWVASMHSRPYRDSQDLVAMARLVSEAWTEHGPHVECTVGDLSWRMYRNAHVAPEQNLRLWVDAQEQLVGFAWRYANRDVDLFVHPREQTAAILPQMSAWMVEGTVAPTAWALESNTRMSQALEALGWQRSGGVYLNLLRSLDGLEPLSAPQGYRIRGVRGTAEVEARAAVHRRGFGSERVTAEVYARVMAAPFYRPDLDLVAEAADGELAALTLCWLDSANSFGELEPVATAPEHRRRGLARALILAALHRLREAGARTAVVYAQADNAASVALYLSLGFEVVDRNLGYAPVAIEAGSVRP